MGFYIRKSVSVGPFRFNLSKSGVGLSVGVKGLRVGAGPRGNYVRMGVGGISYRATLSTSVSPTAQSPSRPQHLPAIQDAALTEIESAETAAIVDSSSLELVTEMNAKKKKIVFWPLVLVAGVLLSIYFSNTALPRVALVVLGLTIGSSVFAWYRDQIRKTTVLFYELDGETEQRLQKLHDVFAELASCRGRWHVSAQGNVLDRKYHAGASTLQKRTSIHIGNGNPPYVKSNVSAPSLPVGKQTLYFFPDKVLVFDANSVGAVSYSHLHIEDTPSRFIETAGVPSDAEVVGSTWKYVNKKGGPDKRFKDNRQLPIALYEELSFRSETGLHEVVQVSRTGFGKDVIAAVRALADIAG